MKHWESSDRSTSGYPFGPRRRFGGIGWAMVWIAVPALLLFVVLVVLDHMKG